jgi:hypothetical protein
MVKSGLQSADRAFRAKLMVGLRQWCWWLDGLHSIPFLLLTVTRPVESAMHEVLEDSGYIVYHALFL